MLGNFWSRPIPQTARRIILWSGALILVALAIALGLWVHFHQSYEQWLDTPPERLQGHPRVLILDAAVVAPDTGSERDLQIDRHLITWQSDRSFIAELSRSDVFTHWARNRAWTKVFLHTRYPEAHDVGRRVEFVSEFVWRDGRWVWNADYNLALE